MHQSTGPSQLVYNQATNEVSYVPTSYLYANDTTTQTGSVGSYTPYYFSTAVEKEGWIHTTGSAMFTGSFATSGKYLLTYCLQIHSNVNPNATLTAYVQLDGNPVPGSSRSATVTENLIELPLSNTCVLSLSAGSHGIQLMQQSTANTITIQAPTQVPGPGESSSAATLTISKII